MGTRYTLFVDESGESGIRNVRSPSSGGASPYMVLGAVLVPHKNYNLINQELHKITNAIGKKNLHCSGLKHHQKVYYSREVSKLKILCFGVISLKSTLHSYREDIDGSSEKYYNKCAKYLLEKVGAFMEMNDIQREDMDIRFEDRNVLFSKLRNFIKACRDKPFYPESNYLKHIDPYQIDSRSKEEEPLMQLADLVAHAIYKCVDKTKGNFQIPETRYLHELRNRFYGDPKNGRIEGYGIKTIHSLLHLKLDADVYDFLNELNLRK